MIPFDVEAEPAANGTARPSQATILVELASEVGVDLFHTPDNEGFATILAQGHEETWPIKSKAFRLYISALFYGTTGKAPNAQAIRDASGVLEGKALFDGPERGVFTRIAELDGAIYLDLGDKQWRAVRITSAGWTVVDSPPVKFRRPKGMLPLPEPGAGTIDELRPFINVRNEDWCLIVAWLTATFRSRGPFPVLALSGEQDAAKTTVARVLRGVIDPNVAPLRAEPRDVRDLMIAAKNGWVIGWDNVSHLPPWLSDALCRLATGGGFATRELYTDDEETLFDATRPVVLTSIEDVVIRGDLANRSLLPILPPIADEQRKTEEDFWAAFEIARPRILGALLDTIAGALKALPEVQLDRLPRMADFARLGTSMERALKWPAGTFMNAYAGNRQAANEVALEASPVAVAVQALANEGPWEGEATPLLDVLTNRVAQSVAREKSWPKSAKGLGGVLRRVAPNLRAAGVYIEFSREPGGKRRRLITIKTGPPFADAASDPAGSKAPNGSDPGDAKGDTSWDANGHAGDGRSGEGTQGDGWDANSGPDHAQGPSTKQKDLVF